MFVQSRGMACYDPCLDYCSSTSPCPEEKAAKTKKIILIPAQKIYNSQGKKITMQKIKQLAEKLALKNASQHDGKASSKAVLGSLLGALPEAKEDVPATMKIIEQTVQDINSMTQEEQQKQITSLKIATAKPKKEKHIMKDLEGVEKTVVMRFAPNPNGPLSFGHSRQAILNWHYVKKYRGKFILRLDDTDPKIKTPLKEAYDWIPEDLMWLGIKPDKIICASSRFQIYYEYAEKLISMGAAYVCTCPREKFAQLKKSAKPCPCRNLTPKEHMMRWKKMFKDYQDGEAVLRIKTDIKHRNPAIRDWPAARIVTNPTHPLVNYRVWPLYDFASAIDDHLLGITHLIRGIDFIATSEKQGYLYKYFNWKYPKDIQTGKLIVEGMKSTSEARKLIEQGKLTGWDDVRLGTLRALKKRGFTPQAITNFITDVGIKKSDIRVSEKNLYAYNKKIIDSKTPRHFYTEDPIEIDISATKHANTSLTIKPPVKSQKERKLNIGTKVYIAKKDYVKYKGEKVRLKELAYGTLEKKFRTGSEINREQSNKAGIQVLQWVPKKDSIDIELIMPDNTRHAGKAESNIKSLNNKIVQFERVGFANLIQKNKKITAYFAHF